MKKIISKILIIFIILIMLFEVIFSSNICNAAGIDEKVINTITNLAGGIVSIVYWPKRITAVGIAFAIDLITANMAQASGTNTDSSFLGLNDVIITPFDIFFNKYKLLDVNFFDLEGVGSDTITYTFRTTVANWFYVMRLIAGTILMVILIYVGIRMALSTIAEDKAKYKKMLYDWVCSLILIFVLQYIAIFTIYCNNAIVAALKSSITDLSAEKAISNIVMEIGLRGAVGIGMPSLAAVLVFIFIVFQTIAFLLAYINRMIKIGFLIIISPLISLTYSIDKMGDGKAQALGSWLKEFIYTILIQPFHCVMYMAFVRPAFSLLTAANNPIDALLGGFFSPEYNQLVNGVLAILCLKFINDGESIVRKIFGFQDDNSSTSMAAGMAVGMMAVKNAQKIGKSTRSGIKFVQNTGNRLSNAASKDILSKTGMVGKFGQTSLGKKMGLEQRAKDRLDPKKIEERKKKKAEKYANRKFKPRTLKNKLWKAAEGGGVKGYLARKTLEKNSLASTLGLMGAAMAYSTGSTDALTAIGAGAAVQKGTNEFFKSSKATTNATRLDSHMQEEAKTEKKLNEDIEGLKSEIGMDKAPENGKNQAEDDYKEYSKYAQINQNNEEIESKEKELDAINKSLNNPSISEKEKKKLEEQKASKEKEIQDLKNANKELNTNDDSPKTVKERMKKLDGEYGNKLSELYSKEQEKANFNNYESIVARMQARATAPGKEELQEKKNEIISNLKRLKMEDKGLSDSSQTNNLTVEENDSIEKTAQALIDNISLSALKGRGIDEASQTDFIKRQLGLSDNDDKLSKNYESVFSATSDYESMERQKCDSNLTNQYAQLGEDPGKLNDDLARMIYNARNGGKKNKTTETSS